MPNYLNVEKEQHKAAALKEVNKEKTTAPLSSKSQAKSLRLNEERLRALAAEEKARREAGTSAESLAVRLAALPAAQLPPQSKPKPLKPMSKDERPHETHDEQRPQSTSSSVHSMMADTGPHAAFRAALESQPVEHLRRFCGEVGIPSQGTRAALIERLAAHAREHHERVKAQGTAERSAGRPPNSASSSAWARRPETEDSPQPASGLPATRPVVGPEPPGSARPATGQSVASFVAASNFGGARKGQVFKKDARGLGYYRDI